MINIIKLILLGSGMACLLLYPMGNLIIVMPSIPFNPLNDLERLGFDGTFVLGFIISSMILYCFSVPLRYSWGIGFIVLLIGLFGSIGLQVYRSEVSTYSLKQVLAHSFHFKYFIEFIVFLFNFIGLLLVYRSNLPEILEDTESTATFE